MASSTESSHPTPATFDAIVENDTRPVMSEPIYISASRIEKVEGVHRRGQLAVGQVLEFGVHGPIKTHYKLDDAADLPLPVDYVVAATGG